MTDAFGLAPGLHDRAFAALDVGKQNLGAARLINFLALAYLVATSPFLGRLARTPAGEALQSLGRHSLAIFAASSLLSALRQAGYAAWGAGAPEGVAKALEFVYTLACIGALFALARHLQWRKTRDGAPPHDWVGEVLRQSLVARRAGRWRLGPRRPERARGRAGGTLPTGGACIFCGERRAGHLGCARRAGRPLRFSPSDHPRRSA